MDKRTTRLFLFVVAVLSLLRTGNAAPASPINKFLSYPECLEHEKRCDPCDPNNPEKNNDECDRRKLEEWRRERQRIFIPIVYAISVIMYFVVKHIFLCKDPPTNEEEENHENRLEETVQFNNDTEVYYEPVPICFGFCTIFRRVDKTTN